MKHHFSATYESVRVRPLEREDIELLRTWRNDSVNTKYLAKLPYITKEMQENWYQAYLADDNIYTWAIFETEELCRCVGSHSLYDFRDGVCESGKTMVESFAAGRGIGPRAQILVMHIGFMKLNGRGIHTMESLVNINNAVSIKHMLKTGFEIEKELTDENGVTNIYFVARREDFYKKHDYLQQVDIVE